MIYSIFWTVFGLPKISPLVEDAFADGILPYQRAEASGMWDGGAIQSVVTGYALDALAIGVIVTDREARLVYANAAADRLLGQKTGALRCRAGRVCMARAETQNDLHAIIERACLGKKLLQSGSNFILASATDAKGPDLSICVLPVEGPETRPEAPHAMLLFRAIERDCNLEIEGRRLFGLTKTEAKFASSLASGLSLAEAARLHDVTLSTARSHMKNIFRKTGVCRQSQVAALLRCAQIPIEAHVEGPARTIAGPPFHGLTQFAGLRSSG